jgi:aspartate/glutamate racemase
VTTEHGLIAIVHTSFVAVDGLTALFSEFAPQVNLRHIVDDSLLDEVLNTGGVTPGVRKRLGCYLEAAEQMGADVIFSQCSSIGEAIDEAAVGISVPVVRIDTRMAELACEAGERIGVVATLGTTLLPTSNLIEKTAKAMSRQIAVDRVLVEGAFDDLRAGDLDLHNAKVIDAVHDLSKRVDVVVCAQGSMAAILPLMGKTEVTVLTSPRTGVKHALEVLDLRLAARRSATMRS